MQSYDDEEYDYLYKGKPRSVGVRRAVLRRARGRVGGAHRRISHGCPMCTRPLNRLKVGRGCLILEPTGTTPSHLAAQHCPPLATCYRC